MCNSKAKVDGSLNIDSTEGGSNPCTGKERNAYTYKEREDREPQAHRKVSDRDQTWIDE